MKHQCLKIIVKKEFQNKVYRKFVGIINEMIIDPLADVSNINDIAGSLVNKMLRLVGADSTTHQTKENLINEIEKLNGRITTSSDFKDQLIVCLSKDSKIY